MQDNQTSLRFGCIPPLVEDYLFLQDENDDEYGDMEQDKDTEQDEGMEQDEN